MEIKYKSSILVSIFRRKGAEGINTKIIDETNKAEYGSSLSTLESDEVGLIIYYLDELNWVLLTNKNLKVNKYGLKSTIANSNITESIPALQEEYKSGVTDKSFFTRIKIKDSKNEQYILDFEKGPAYRGFYQVLHYIASRNASGNVSD